MKKSKCTARLFYHGCIGEEVVAMAVTAEPRAYIYVLLMAFFPVLTNSSPGELSSSILGLASTLLVGQDEGHKHTSRRQCSPGWPRGQPGQWQRHYDSLRGAIVRSQPTRLPKS